MEFIGSLHDDKSFKKFFLTCDALLPLEWRLSFIHGDDNLLPEILPWFDRIVCLDTEFNNWHAENSDKIYISNELNDYWEDELPMLDSMGFKGIDELHVNIHIIERTPAVIKRIQTLDTPIRRIDVRLPEYGFEHNVDLKELESWCKTNDIMFNIITMYDPPEVDASYSKPGFEGIVDPMPEPYEEDGEFYSVTGGSPFWYNDFYLNIQQKPRLTCQQKPFATAFEPIEFMLNMIKAKLELYTRYANDIQHKNKNIYWMYFNWVANNIVINDDFNFIPDVMLPKYSSYYKQLVEREIFQDTPLGLIKPGVALKPIIEVK